ncbi:hypothetical protein VTK26DRAFT_7682 [Humicola hyalothermophila]
MNITEGLLWSKPENGRGHNREDVAKASERRRAELKDAEEGVKVDKQRAIISGPISRERIINRLEPRIDETRESKNLV